MMQLAAARALEQVLVPLDPRSSQRPDTSRPTTSRAYLLASRSIRASRMRSAPGGES
jgi:hypothetical protein